MQIPSNLQDPFIKSMSEKGDHARNLFLKHVEVSVKKVPVKVMLGDGTVSNQESFDPSLIRQFYDIVLKKLDGWESNGVSVTADQDLRRSFIKLETREDKYILSCHMSLQYHALLFYKLDHRVLDIQRQLSELSDMVKKLEENAAPESNKIIEEKLKKKGYESMDQQKIFEVLFEHDEIRDELLETLKTNQQKITELTAKRDSLFKELDNLLIEIYHTNPAMIDEMKMIAAEEGCLCVFNLEYEKKDSGKGSLNLSKIPIDTREKLLKRMDDVLEALKF